MAFLRTGRFDLAAQEVGCDRETVSSTWNRYREILGEVIDGIKSLGPERFDQ